MFWKANISFFSGFLSNLFHTTCLLGFKKQHQFLTKKTIYSWSFKSIFINKNYATYISFYRIFYNRKNTKLKIYIYKYFGLSWISALKYHYTKKFPERPSLKFKIRRIVRPKLRPFHFQIKTYHLSDANYLTNSPSQTNNPFLVWIRPFSLKVNLANAEASLLTMCC